MLMIVPKNVFANVIVDPAVGVTDPPIFTTIAAAVAFPNTKLNTADTPIATAATVAKC